MQHSPNPMANLYQSQLAASSRFADAVFSGTEKLDHLVLEATHRVVSEQLRLAQVLVAGVNPVDAQTAATFIQRNSSEAVNYQAEIMRVVAEMQTEIGQSMQDYIEQIGSRPEREPEPRPRAAREPMPDVGGMMSNPVTGMLSMWENAFKEATAMAARNMALARSNVEQAAEATGSQARTATRAAQHAAEQTTEAIRKSAGVPTNGSGARRR